MNHKRKKPKNSRAGCLYCKPHKANHAPKGGRPEKEDAKRKAALDELVAQAQRMGFSAKVHRKGIVLDTEGFYD